MSARKPARARKNATNSLRRSSNLKALWPVTYQVWAAPAALLSVTVEQVQKAVPKQAVLLELLRYSHHLGANKHEPRYGAVVLAASGEPKWVPLGSAAAIETNIVLYQDAVRGAPVPRRHRLAPRRPERNHPPSTINHQPSSFAPLLQALYQQLWAPIEPVLPKGTKTVLISPDGALNFLSFATLLTPEDQFLSQKYSIRYVASGRDLLKEKKPSPAGAWRFMPIPTSRAKAPQFPLERPRARAFLPW